MLTIQEWLTDATAKLLEAYISSARLDCLVILEDTLEKPREWLLAHSDEDISNLKVDILNKRLAQRLKHIPLAYITGHKEFYGRSFLVNPNVLIPRPESEDIIELLLGIGESSFEKVIDIGTGSGCLAITVKLELPNSQVIAIDNSSKALEVVKQNAKHLDADIELKISYLLESVDISDRSVLLVNLPYVPESLITSEEITKEPSAAIFSGKDGLDHYKRFWRQLAHTKARDLVVISESLLSQHGEMTNLAKESGFEIDRSHGLAQMFVSVYKSGA